MAEHKILGIILSVGLLIVAGIFWMLDDTETAPHESGAETVAVAPPDASTGTDKAAAPQVVGEPLDEEMAGKVLVSNRPVQVLAEPSASASAMFGFPAGRPFRPISRKDGFIRIQDVRSGASGWIEEAALAPAPEPEPVAASPSSAPTQRSATSGGRPSNNRSASEPETAAAAPEPEPKRRGLFGGGGILGGLFGGR